MQASQQYKDAKFIHHTTGVWHFGCHLYNILQTVSIQRILSSFFKLLVSISSHLKSVKLFFLPPGARFELQKWHAGWFTTSMKQNRHNIPPHRLFIANNKDFTINQIYMYLLWNWSNQNTNMGKRIHMSFHYLISYLSICYKGT